MGINDVSLAAVAASVLRDAKSPVTIASAREVVRSGRGRSLVAQILANVGFEQDDFKAVNKSMALFEDIANIDFFVGGALMAELCSWAGPRFMHDVCDAVTLWMFDYKNRELGALLRAAASTESDPDMLSWYRQWVAGCESTRSRADLAHLAAGVRTSGSQPTMRRVAQTVADGQGSELVSEMVGLESSEGGAGNALDAVLRVLTSVATQDLASGVTLMAYLYLMAPDEGAQNQTVRSDIDQWIASQRSMEAAKTLRTAASTETREGARDLLERWADRLEGRAEERKM